MARIKVVAMAMGLVMLGGCGHGGGEPAPSGIAEARVLRDLTPEGVLIGSSVVGGGHQVSADHPYPFVTDEAYRTLLATHFSALTPENVLKWELVHPARDRFDFAAADAMVDFAAQHAQQVRGHTLMWHQQNPAWLTAGAFTADELREILREHIATVVGHYAGKIDAWDVANEIFDDNGLLRTNNPFLGALGAGVIADAFRWAHEADPDAVLYLNDYNIESNAAKRSAYLDLVEALAAQGVPVGGMGVQGHLSLEYPFPSDLPQTLASFADLGLEVAITELDVRIPLHGAAPTDAQLAQQADYYRRAVAACLAADRCRSLTFWGAPDPYSWVPSFFPADGAATPFADAATPKPAFTAIAEALAAGR